MKLFGLIVGVIQLALFRVFVIVADYNAAGNELHKESLVQDGKGEGTKRIYKEDIEVVCILVHPEGGGG